MDVVKVLAIILLFTTKSGLSNEKQSLEKQEQEEAEEQLQQEAGELYPDAPSLLQTISDIESLSKLVLLRDHLVIDPTSQTDIEEALMDKLLDYLYMTQNRPRGPGGRRLFPTTVDRNLDCKSASPPAADNEKSLCQVVSSKCLSAADMINLLPNKQLPFHEALARLCPLMLFRHKKPLCRPQNTLTEELSNKQKPVPSSEKVWGFGLLFVTLSIVVSMGGLIVMPFVKREARKIILTLFEGLAVGGLVGSAVLHLFPKAYNIVDEYRAYFWKVFLIFGGIYLFYILERILKIITTIKGGKTKTKRRRNSSYREDDFNQIVPKPRNSLTPSIHPTVVGLSVAIGSSKDQSTKGSPSASEKAKSALIRSSKTQLDKCLASVNKPSATQGLLSHHRSQEAQLGCSTKDQKTSSLASKQSYVTDVAGKRQDQETATLGLPTDTVAWMIVLGDASLNFIDGLSIGAAFDRNILAGISIAVAVMLEEVTHRLGTFAVLIRAGMEMKQSFLWIFISACALYPGLVIGIILGDWAEDASPYIFALAGGMFLYMALVDVMKEMNRSMENATRKGVRSALQILALQNLGIIIAIIVLSVLALYEQDMDFEQVALYEALQNN